MLTVTSNSDDLHRPPARLRQPTEDQPARSAWRDNAAWTDYRLDAETPAERGMGCTRLVAALVAFGFLVLALISLFAVTLAGTITDRAAIKRAVDAEALTDEVAPGLLTQIDLQQAGPAELVQVDEAVLEAAVRELVSPQWVQAQADRAVDAVFDYLQTGDPIQAEAEIDMRSLLTRLRSGEGQAIVRAGLEALPPCAEPIPTVAAGEGPVILDCRPTSVPIDELTQQVHQAAAERADEALDAGGVLHVPLVDDRSLTPAQRQDLEQIRRLYRLARHRALLLWLAPAGALALIALLAVRSLRDVGRWWGLPLTVAGVIGLVGALLVLGWTWFAEDPLPASLIPAAGMAGFVEHFVVTLTRLWLQQVAIQAAVLLGVGIVMLAVGKYLGNE